MILLNIIFESELRILDFSVLVNTKKRNLQICSCISDIGSIMYVHRLFFLEGSLQMYCNACMTMDTQTPAYACMHRLAFTHVHMQIHTHKACTH